MGELRRLFNLEMGSLSGGWAAWGILTNQNPIATAILIDCTIGELGLMAFP
jgi:hypothetical protein